MSGISEIQSRIQAIQTRVANPPIAGRFDAVFQAQLASASTQTTPTEEASANPVAEFSVTPLGSQSTAQTANEFMTLGMMLGVTAPTTTVRSGSIYTRAELDNYMQVHNIEERNGRLATSELTEVSGNWFGTGHLLAPAAESWEQMRSAAAADGIDLQATDMYRSWESQNRAYQAHLRGEKEANVLPPGTSEHGNGLAVDITNGQIIGRGDPEWDWMNNNAAQFGWYPISNETWHWEFRGV